MYWWEMCNEAAAKKHFKDNANPNNWIDVFDYHCKMENFCHPEDVQYFVVIPTQEEIEVLELIEEQTII